MFISWFIFSNTTSNPRLVKNAAKVMEIMIENFTCPLLFGKDNLEFFSEVGLHSDTENHVCSDDNSLNNKVQGDY